MDANSDDPVGGYLRTSINMPDLKSRARLLRLLTDDFRQDDLTGLFLYARDHCDGREAVADIGHFVAHHHERDKGIVTRSTREWVTTAKFHMNSFGDNFGAPLIAEQLPSVTHDYLKIAVRRIGPKIISRETKLRFIEANDLMDGFLARFTRNNDGTWSVPDDMTQKEFSLLKCACSVLVSKPAFDANTLVDGFIDTMKSNGLITKEEIRRHREKLSVLVQLFAISAMHNCVIHVGEGQTTQIKARASEGGISVDAIVTGGIPGHPEKGFLTSMFLAELDPIQHCHKDLLVYGHWDFEIEVAQDAKLSRFS